MKQPHELYLILGDAFARKAGIDPQALHDACAGLPTSPVLVEGLVGALAPRLTRQHFVLSSETKNGTLGTMSATEFATAPRGRPMENLKHPLMAALKKAGVTVAEEAASVKRSPPSLRSFCKPKGDPSSRPCPRALADHWKRTRGVPLSAWARIGD